MRAPLRAARLRTTARSSTSDSLGALLREYAQAAGPYKRKAVWLTVAIVINGLLEGLALTALIPALNRGLANGHGSRHGFVDGIFASGSDATIITRSLTAFVVLGLASGWATYLVGRLTVLLRFAMEADMRQRMSRSLLNMRWLSFLEMRLGDITKITLLDGSQAAAGLVSLVRAVGTLFVTAAFFALALLISVPMTAFTVAFGAAAAVAYRTVAARATRQSAELSAVTDELTRETTEVFGSYKYVRASGYTHEAERRLQKLVERSRAKSIESQLPQTGVRFLYESSGVVFVGAFLAFTLLASHQPVGNSLVFLAVFYRLAPRITAINEALYLSRIMLPWYQSWRTVLQRALASTEVPGGVVRPTRFTSIRAVDLGFSYGGDGDVLSDTSLELRRGTCTAVVGQSGSGKTTLMDLMVGLLQPTRGTVLVDDVPLTDIDTRWWRERLGIVMQDSPLFAGTIAENVALGDEAPDEQRVTECLRVAAAYEFVAAMPAGMRTQVGERGTKLSGGQRQRLALARALYRDPMLLCLDEATSALDADSERMILAAIDRIKQDRPVLLVTHRLHTLSVADQILLLDSGRVVERGSWSDLTSRDTRFRKLIESQP